MDVVPLGPEDTQYLIRYSMIKVKLVLDFNRAKAEGDDDKAYLIKQEIDAVEDRIRILMNKGNIPRDQNP